MLLGFKDIFKKTVIINVPYIIKLSNFHVQFGVNLQFLHYGRLDLFTAFDI